jgi:hypothetical protein
VYASFQEVPTGWLRGKVVAEESGQPLAGALVRLERLAPFQAEAQGNFSFPTRKDGSFRSGPIPAGTYRLEASSEAHALRPTRVEVVEAKLSELALELSPGAPSLTLQMSQHVFTPREPVQVVGHGFSPDSALVFRLYRVDPVVLLRRHRGRLYEMLQPEGAPEGQPLEDNPALTKEGQSELPITKRDLEGVFHQRFDLGARPSGIYVIEGQLGDLRERSWAMITGLGLVVKHAPGESTEPAQSRRAAPRGSSGLAFVADLVTGDPVPGAKVSFYGEEGPAVSATTDAHGLCNVSLPKGEQQYQLLATAEKDGSLAFLTSWVYRNEGEGDDRVYCYTDRPVYRPGDRVRFKGMARRYVEPGYRVLAREPVTFEVRDARDTLVYRGQLTTNAYGSYDGDFSLSDEAATGYYEMRTTIQGREHTAGFKVAEYRKPEYVVEVTTGRKRYTRGERIQAEISAQYYFGAPVGGARVAYSVMRSPYWFYPEEQDTDHEGEDYQGNYYSYGEVVEQGEAVTDEEGIARLSIATRRPLGLAPEGDEEESDSYRYTIAVTVTDPSRKEVTGQGSTIVTAGEFALIARPTRYVQAPGEVAEVEVEARDYEKRPVARVSIAAAGSRESYTGTRFHAERVTEGMVTTDVRGKARFRFTPEVQGYYRVRCTAHDARGNMIRASAFIWVTSGEYSDLPTSYPEIEIITDKKAYRVGETATVLVNAQQEGATALVAIEGPRLYDYRLVPLKGNSTRLEVPVRVEYAPNFFISVCFVRDKQFISQTRRVGVSVAERELRLAVKPNKQVYSPGERAVYRLTATDWQGKPVAGEFSVGVVDEAIYAIQEEMAEPIMRFFYPPRDNAVSTDYSFPSVYLDADKSAAGIKVRKRFPDTAYWNPTVVTGPDGKGQVSFEMPDTLTTWRATVRGATMATEVGQAVAKVRCIKDLLVRLETPRFLVQNDRLTISAVAHNYTRSRQEVSIWLSAPGLVIRRGPTSSAPARLTLSRDGVKRQDWEIEVPRPGRPEVTVYAKGASGLSDAMALTLPALPHGRERVEWRTGGVQQTETERLSVRRDAIAGTADLRIRLSPSVAAVLFGALDYLAQYPYGCTEQTMSAFLPDVVVARALQELQLPYPELEKKLPDMVRKGCDRLYRFQHDDGGWGWWRYDDSDPWMTAYVVFGLLTAKQAGFYVNEEAVTRATARMKEWLTEVHRLSPRDEAYTCYVLALAGKGHLVDPRLTKLSRRANSLDTATLSFLTAALLARSRLREARAVANQLENRATKTQALVWWEGAGAWDRGGAVETTALVFRSLYSLDPHDQRLMRVVRWLVQSRQGNCWVSTRDTAFAVLALTDFVKQTEELKPDFQATVSLDGTVLLRRHFSRDDLFTPEVEIRTPATAVGSGDHALRINKQGVGNLYYTAVLKQTVFQEDLPRVITGAGISVERAYHRLVRQRNPATGAITTLPEPTPTTEFRAGEPILVRLTIRAPAERDYVIVEDPLPAGCEVVERGDLEPWEWSYWYSDMEVRDEKVAFFARRLPGNCTLEYHLRPQIPGDYHVMPTEVYSMYNPDVRGSGAETRVRLR